MTLYEQDFALWSEAQARAVRERRWTEVDIDNVAEELESLSWSQRHEIRLHLTTMISRLLEYEVRAQRSKRARPPRLLEDAVWIASILEDSPSLRPELPALLQRAYRLGRRLAAIATGLSLSDFNETPTPAFEAKIIDEVGEL